MEKVAKKPKFNYSKLRGKITEVCGTQKEFARLLGITDGTLTSKLMGYNFFTQTEIYKSVRILHIEQENPTVYFFTV